MSLYFLLKYDRNICAKLLNIKYKFLSTTKLTKYLFWKLLQVCHVTFFVIGENSAFFSKERIDYATSSLCTSLYLKIKAKLIFDKRESYFFLNINIVSNILFNHKKINLLHSVSMNFSSFLFKFTTILYQKARAHINCSFLRG